MKITKSGWWSDAELLCQLVADGLDDLSFWVRQLGGRCYRNAVEAKRQREANQ